MNTRNNRGMMMYVLFFAAVIVVIAILLRSSMAEPQERAYSDVLYYFDNYMVSDMTLDLGKGKLVMKVDGEEAPISYTVPSVSVFLEEIQYGEENYRKEYNDRHPGEPLKLEYIEIQDNSWIITVALPTAALLIMVVLFMFMLRQAGGGKINNFGKANVKNSANRKHTFKDVAGAKEEKEELEEIVDFLKNPKKFTDIGARIPKGVLLVGPPGTGKTLLAKAVSGEAGVPFFSISGSDFVEMYVGVGASRVRDLFETAKKNSPAIVFIDEIDAVGRHRGAGLGGGHDEREQTLNQLLVEMDGFEGNEGIIIIAATNRQDILDPALLRPGRFDRQITVNYPDIKGREEILKVHAKGKKLGPDVDLEVIAKTTQGFTGADLENLLNEAALLAARNSRKAITEADIEEATFKVMAGPEKKSAVVIEKDRQVTAYHEAGHAVAAFYLESQEKVHQVSIIPRGDAGGWTFSRNSDSKYWTKRKMYEKIVMALGGRVAEKIVFDEITTGASSDLKQSTKLANAMVTRYGFSDNIGCVVYADENDEIFIGRDYGHTKSYSEKIAAEIDSEIKAIIESAYKKCEEILREHMDKLEFLSNYLLKFEKIDGEGFEKLMNGEITEEVLEDNKKDDQDNTESGGEDIGKIFDKTVDDDNKDEEVQADPPKRKKRGSSGKSADSPDNDADNAFSEEPGPKKRPSQKRGEEDE